MSAPEHNRFACQDLAAALLLLSKSALMHSRLVPQREFYSIAHPNLVVDDAEIVANHMFSYP